MATNTQITVRASNTVDSMFRLLRSYDPADLIAREILQNAIVRRLSTPRGTFWTDPDYGYDVVDLVNEGLTNDGLARIPLEIKQEISKEERVRSCEVEVTELSGSIDSKVLKVKIYIVPNTIGPFTFTLEINNVTIKTLTGNANI